MSSASVSKLQFIDKQFTVHETPALLSPTTQSTVINERTLQSTNSRCEAQDAKGESAIIEQEILSDFSQWQDSVHDLPQRRAMLQRILAIAQRYRRPSEQEPENSGRQEALLSLAKRIELSLYSRAASMDEYQNYSTLRRRLQALISFTCHETAAYNDGNDGVSLVTIKENSCMKRRLASSVGNSKRRRLASERIVLKSKPQGNSIFPCLDEDTLRHTFAFLTGRNIVLLRGINKFAAKFLPTCVTSLSVSVPRMLASFSNGQSEYGAITTFTNLQRLTVYKDYDPCPTDPNIGNSKALRAWCCNELDTAEDNSGESLILTLVDAIQAGACSQLEYLQLVAIFTNTLHRNGLRSLCSVLAEGKCPKLRDLLLGGNSVGDIGSLYIARVLQSKALPRLERLDLRRNYIGELGVRRLMSVLNSKQASQLKYLCFGGNIITDKCVSNFTSIFESEACPHLRFLGLEDNYLSPDGVQRIIQSAVESGMIPRLYRVANDMATT